MSRKHYVRTAEIIANAPISSADKEILATEFAQMFADDNPAFRPSVFFHACGVPE